MADRSGPDLTSPDKIFLLNKDGRAPSKKQRLEQLMEVLRGRSRSGGTGKAGRTWSEAAKLLRMSMTDKKHQVETSEKHKISMHLSVLQSAFKVSSQKAMVERVEQTCTELSLDFTKGACPVVGGASTLGAEPPVKVFVNAVDLFYLEIVVDPHGGVVDVKLCHGGEPALCMEIVKLLNESKFEEFREHLQRILDIYSITSDKKLKTKAFTALQSLETDLNNLSKLQCTITSVPNFIHKSPLGILMPRVAGTPMKLVYFVGPYDLLDKKTKTSKPMTIEAITENDLGHSVTVTLEPFSSPQKLQTMSLMTVNKTHDGKSLPSFASVNNMNSSVLSGIFVLRLHRKMAVTWSVLKAIQKATDVEFEGDLKVKSFVDVLVEQILGEKASSDVTQADGMHVNLPDQSQRLFVSCAHGGRDLEKGALVDKIPFLHPTSVPTVVKLLRQQALFNTVLGSCVRHASSNESEHQLTFDVTPLNLQTVSVSFEHPFTDAIATADLDLSDITCLRCRISSVRTDGSRMECDTPPPEICSDETATRIFQRCLSLPIMLRSVFHECQDRMESHFSRVAPPTPPPVAKPTPLFCLQTLQNNSLHLSRKGQERRTAFLNASANHRDRHKIVNNSFLGASMGVVLPGVTQASMTVTTSTATVAVPTPKYHQAAATATTTVHKSATVTTSKANNSISREGRVISPEVITAYESGIMDSTHTKESLEYIKKDKITKNPMLASLLDQERDSPESVVSQSSMLSALLVTNCTSSHTQNTNSVVSATDMPVPKQQQHVAPSGMGGMVHNSNQSHAGQMHPQMASSHHHQQQPHLKQANMQKPRKRKSTGENKANTQTNAIYHGTTHPMGNNANNNMGRSPKRLLSEEEHPLFSTFSPISSAENDPSHHPLSSPMGLHPPPPHPHHRQHPPHHQGQHPHHTHNLPHHPHHNQQQTPHPHHQAGLVAAQNGPNHALLDGFGPNAGPPHSSAHHPHLANFPAQTRVGGDFPPLSVVSSSVAMVTESSNSQSPHSISSTPPSNSSLSTGRQSSYSGPPLSGSSSHSNAVSSGAQSLPSQSPIACLSNSLDSLLSKETHQPKHASRLSPANSSTSNPLAGNSGGGSSNSGSSVANTSKYNELLTLLNDQGESTTPNRRPSIGPVNASLSMDNRILMRQDSSNSSSSAIIKTEGGQGGGNSRVHSNQSPSLAGGGKVISQAASQDNIKKEESSISLSMECESIDAAPAKDRTLSATFLDYKNAKEGKRPRLSAESSDPFEFPDAAIDNSCSVGSGDLSDVSLEFIGDEDEDESSSGTTPPKYKVVNSSKERLNNVDYSECYRKDRKKSGHHATIREYSVEENKRGGPVLGITMKINAKDGSAKTIVKQSPLHPGSNQEYEVVGSNRKWKESSRSRYSVGGDRMSDSSMDGDVFVTMTTDSKHHHSSSSPSGHMYNSQNSIGSSSRILGGSKKHGTDGYVSKDKKKKSSKLGSESKQEKKRKRAAEAREKDQLIKKQKVYDFDFNESEHLPPTKIKIRTSDGRVQIQTDSMKTYSMSPLPMKPDAGSPAANTTTTGGGTTATSGGKRHKSEKSGKHKKDKGDKYNRSRSETQGKTDKNDSKLYNKRPVVKIKPLENTNAGVSTLSVSMPTDPVVTKVILHNHSSPLTSGSVIKTSPLAGPAATPSGQKVNILPVQKSNKEFLGNKESELSSNVVEVVTVTPETGLTTKTPRDLKDNQPVSVALKTSRDSSVHNQAAIKSSSSSSSTLVSSKTSKEVASPVVLLSAKNSNKESNAVKSSNKEATSSTSSPSVLKSNSSKPSTPTLTTALRAGREDSSSPVVTSEKHKLTSSSSSSIINSSSAESTKTRPPTSTGSSESAKNGHTSNQPSTNDSKPKAEQEKKRAASVAAPGARGSPVLTSSSSGDKVRSLSEKTGSSSDKVKVKVNNSVDKDVKVKSDKVIANDLQSKVKVNTKESTESGKVSKEKPSKEGDGQVKVKSNKVVSSKEGEAPSTGVKASSTKSSSDKSGGGSGGGATADPQKKQRKGSLTAVIDKLKKGFKETPESKPKKAQNMYDAIRHEILKAGDNKSSTLPIGKIGKKSKSDSPSQQTSSSQSGSVPNQKSVTGPSGINPKSNSSSPAQNQKITTGNLKSNSNPAQNQKNVNPTSGQNQKNVNPASGQNQKNVTAASTNVAKTNSTPGQNPKMSGGGTSMKTAPTANASHKGANALMDGILPKRGPSTNFRIPKTESKSFPPKHEATDHVTNKGSSVQSAGNPGTQAKSGYGQTAAAGSTVNHVMAKNTGPTGPNQFNRQNSKEPDNKAKKLKLEDISEKLQSRHFLDVVDSIATKEEAAAGVNEKKSQLNSSQVQKGVNKNTVNSRTVEANPKDPRTWNSHVNNAVSDGLPRSKSPVVGHVMNKLEKGVVNNTSPSSHGNSGNKSSGGSGGSNSTRVNNQLYSSSQKSSTNIKQPRPSGLDNNKKHVNNLLDQPKIIPINKTRDPRVASKEGSASPQPTVSSNSSTSSNPPSDSGSSQQPIAYYNPAAALGRKATSNDTPTPSSSVKQPTSSLKEPQGRPKVTIISESPASPTEKPGLTIRHDTPPASPILHATDTSDNKENLAKSIPLGEDKGRFKAPTPPKAEESSHVTIRQPTKPAGSSHLNMGFDKSSKAGGNSENKVKATKRLGDPSSPDDCVITEVSAVTKPIVSKAPVTIPLERSRARSRSPIDQRPRSPLTPRSPIAVQVSSPKDLTVSISAVITSKTGSNPEASCKGLKVVGGLEERGGIQSPVTNKGCSQMEENDLMNDALIISMGDGK